jgi:hypothetical protein
VQGPRKFFPVVSKLVIPLKKDLNTRDPRIFCCLMQIIQALAKVDSLISEALVPYYRQILPVFQEFLLANIHFGHRIEFGQRKKLNLSDLIVQTLKEMEKSGGPEAFINIEYMIPMSQSYIIGGEHKQEIAGNR